MGRMETSLVSMAIKKEVVSVMDSMTRLRMGGFVALAPLTAAS